MHCLLCHGSFQNVLQPAEDGRQYFQCSNCGLVWLDSRQRLASLEEKQRYMLHNNSCEIPEYREYLSRLALPVVSYLEKGAAGLDYGCGPVEGMRFLLEPRGFRVDSYDPIFFAEEKLTNNSYDFLLCNEAAEHFYAPAEEFRRINDLLKAGGIAGFSSRILPPMEQFSSWSYRRDPTHVCFYAEETVRWIARWLHWEVLRLESPFWLFRKL